jgi:hypothetical protein
MVPENLPQVAEHEYSEGGVRGHGSKSPTGGKAKTEGINGEASSWGAKGNTKTTKDRTAR